MSGNARGRPRTGLALAEAIRERIDPQRITDMLLAFADDDQVPLEKRLATLLPWVQLGYLRPPNTHAIAISDGTGPQRDWTKLTLEQRRTMLALADAAAVPMLDGETSDAG